MEIDDRPVRTLAEIIKQDCYTPEELATLLEMDVNLIREEAYQGRLRAVIVDHHIVGISRAEALHWLDARR
jgi:hypothetical protein